jgi:hypothetical protein
MAQCGKKIPVGKKIPAAFATYEAGKERRYSLLFSVNGGAFTVAKLLSGSKPELVLGGLSLANLAIGMLVFTVLMSADIYFFGEHMRSTIPDTEGTKRSDYIEIFGLVGKCVLGVIATLLCGGWLLVAMGKQ